MVTSKPETLRSYLFPTFFICWFLGMGIIEYPIGRPRKILGFIYSLAISISYVIVIFISYDMILRLAGFLDSPVAGFAFDIFTFVNILMITGNLVRCMVLRKEHNHCLMELVSIDAEIQTMSSSRQFHLRQQIWHFLGFSFIFFTSVISDYFFVSQLHPVGETTSGISFWYTFHYPLYISTCGDIAFSIFNKKMTQSVEDLNSLLNSMKIEHSDGYNTRMGNLIRIAAILEDKKKLEKLRCVRKIYTRLIKLARRWTELNAPHIVSSIIFAIWMGTIQAYNIYRKLFNTKNIFPGSLILFNFLLSITFHILKLFIIVCPTTALTTEAQQTGKILLEHLWPIAFLRSEVLDFAWQLARKPLRLSACGLFDLDYTLIQMVVNCVVTYIVVLVQSNIVDSNGDPFNPPSSNLN